MTTAEHLSPRAPSLGGSRILVVQTRPSAVLGIGAALVRLGARVNVCRSSHAALDVMGSPGRAFDAAVLDGELSRASLMRLSRALRERPDPCLSVGVGTPADDAAVRRLVDAGVVELVIPPVSADAVVEALGRCVERTRGIRERIESSPRSLREAGRRRSPPHWSLAGGAQPVPRFNPDIEAAVDRYAVLVRLSPRETSVLKLIALGYLYDEIGEVLSIANRTVKMHAANVRKKVGAPNRMALVRKVLCA
ncbi:MAG: LuxR C-terminal-related transcriptional regulator [Nannocystaceae bacterium]|nr:LuxR C-terminal-related transcriptional regulator [Nannocystaceae bacterium]